MFGISIMAAAAAATSSKQLDPLEWVVAPPVTGAIGVDYTATWQGGIAPYHVTITHNGIVDTDTTSAIRSVTLNVNGLSEPPGVWVWRISDATGTVITTSMTVYAPYYLAYRATGGTSSPSTTTPFTMEGEGYQTYTFDLKNGKAAVQVNCALYAHGSISAISGGTANATYQYQTGGAVSVTVQNGYTLRLEPVSVGQTLITGLTSTPQNARGELLVKVINSA